MYWRPLMTLGMALPLMPKSLHTSDSVAASIMGEIYGATFLLKRTGIRSMLDAGRGTPGTRKRSTQNAGKHMQPEKIGFSGVTL
jgi:hypothetical protein